MAPHCEKQQWRQCNQILNYESLRRFSWHSPWAIISSWCVKDLFYCTLTSLVSYVKERKQLLRFCTIPIASDQRTDDSRNSTLICAPLLLSIKHEPTLMLSIAIFSPKTYNMYSQYLNFGETDNVHLDLVCIGITFFFSLQEMSLAQQR